MAQLSRGPLPCSPGSAVVYDHRLASQVHLPVHATLSGIVLYRGSVVHGGRSKDHGDPVQAWTIVLKSVPDECFTPDYVH